jgi:hypothetical protein
MVTPSIAKECADRLWATHLEKCGERGGDTPALENFVCDCEKCVQHSKP